MILTLEGARFHTIPGFYAEVNRVFMAGEDWQLGESLDALDDLFYGGYGAAQGAFSLIWAGIEKSRSDLGFAETERWLMAKLAQPGRFNAALIEGQLADLHAGRGQTFFDIVAEIIAGHDQITLVAG